ncbi:MAG: hypothetical protein M1468_01530 [Candidatus Thermoplasmatota archaeon]|nr:hypothetical protein [Candidatus Thermoplasmatota archaeon]
MDLSINRIVKNIVTNDIFLATSLNKGYVNLSAVARDLIPVIEAKLGEKVNIEAIISALKRNRGVSRRSDGKVFNVLSETSVHLLTSIAKIVIPVKRNEKVFRDVVDLNLSGALYISTGSEYTTLIVENRNLPEISDALRRGVIDKRMDLAVIIIKAPVSLLETPGFLMSLYSKLAFTGINIEETTNSYTDAIIVVKESDASEAFMSLLDLINFAKSQSKL